MMLVNEEFMRMRAAEEAKDRYNDYAHGDEMDKKEEWL